MHKFDYKKQVLELYTPEVMSTVTYLNEHKGKQDLYTNTRVEVLEYMVEFSKLHSTISSNRIEGIEVPVDKAYKILNYKLDPVSRDERQVAGYKKVLDLVHTSWDSIPIKPSVILQLHRDMYSFSDVEFKGKYKITDNAVIEIDAQGNRRIRFAPVSAVGTPNAMEQMCKSFNEAWKDEHMDKLLLTMMFIVDFLCIHPFSDGNGRISRLLTLLLLYKCGFVVGKYISIERIIEDTRETYYDVLKLTSQNWHENKCNYKHFVEYMLGVLTAAYGEFENRLDKANDASLTKPDVIEATIFETLGKITKDDLRELCPGISDITIQRTLADLQKRDKIEKHGGGRYTYYVAKL